MVISDVTALTPKMNSGHAAIPVHLHLYIMDTKLAKNNFDRKKCCHFLYLSQTDKKQCEYYQRHTALCVEKI